MGSTPMADFTVAPRRRDSPGMQLWKATAPMIALGLMAVVAVYVVASEQSPAVSVHAQAGSWAADHTGMKMNVAKRTSKLDWGGAEEYMADDAAKIASNKGYLDEIEQAEGEQTQETVDNAALARGEEIK